MTKILIYLLDDGKYPCGFTRCQRILEGSYVWGQSMGGGIGGLLSMRRNGEDYFYLYDGKGNVTTVVDSSQSVVATYQYNAFARLINTTGTLDQPYQFSTKRYDADTGLNYYGFRFYAPVIERWLNRDPLGEAGGINLYGFVGENPVNAVDPWGLHGWAGPIDGTSVIPTGACHSGKPTNIYWTFEGGIVLTGGISHEVCCDGNDKILITTREICYGTAGGIEVSFTQDSTEIPQCSQKKVGDVSWGTETGGSCFLGGEFDTFFDKSGGGLFQFLQV